MNGGHREVPHHLLYVPPLYIYRERERDIFSLMDLHN